jgi:hypothetical protein
MSSRLIKTYSLIVAIVIASPMSFAKEKAKAPVTSKKAKSAKTAPLEELRLSEGDEKGNETKSLKAELLIANSEEKAIAQALKLIKKYKGTNLEPDLHFRLAELYMRKSRSLL